MQNKKCISPLFTLYSRHNPENYKAMVLIEINQAKLSEVCQNKLYDFEYR